MIVPGGDDPLGYAIYEVPGLVDERPVELSFQAAGATIVPGGSEELPLNFFIAVSDFSQNAWDIFGPFRKDPDTGLLPDVSEVLNSATRKDRYVNAVGSLFYAVVAAPSMEFATGSNPQGLSGVRIASSTIQTLDAGNDSDYVMTKPLYTPLQVEVAAQGGKGGSDIDPSQFTTLRWTHYYDPADNNLSAIQYQIYRTDPGGVEKEIGSKNAPGAVFVDPTDVIGASIPPLVPGESYLYRLRAFNVNGFTGYSTAQVTVPLLAPTNVQATKNLTDDRIRISWAKSAGATHYSVYEWVSGEWTPRSGTLDDVDYWDWKPVGDHALHTFSIRAFRQRLADGNFSASPYSASATGEVNYAPQACFTTDPDPPYGDPPLQVDFDATCSSDQDGTVAGYSWDFDGDGAADDFWLAQTNHTYAEPGSFEATLTVTDDLGATDTQVLEVRVGNPPIACFTADPDSGPAPLVVHFDASCSSDTDATDVITAVDWAFGDGSEEGHGTEIDHTFNSGGRYTVELTVTDDEGLTDRETLEVFVDTTPASCFDANVTEGAPPLSVDFDASCSEDPDGGAIVKYYWDIDYSSGIGFEPEYQFSVPTLTHQYTISGTYQVVLRVEDNEGTQEDSSIATITVNSPPTADLVATPNTGNQPLMVELDASGSSDPEDGTDLQYSFDFGEGAGFGAWGADPTPPQNEYDSVGVYTAKVKVKDQNGKESTAATATITVTNTPPVADLTATPDSGAPPLEVQFDASGSDDADGSITKFEWDWTTDGTYDLDSGTDSTPPPHNYPDAGTYTAKVRVTDNDNDTDTATVTITVSDPRTEWWMFGKDAKHHHRSSFTGPATNGGRWTFTSGGGLESSLAISSSGTIYFGSNDHKLYALNPDGSERWSYTTGAEVRSSPALASDGTVYVGSDDALLYAVNPTGTLKWSYETGGPVTSSPAVGPDGTVYVGSGDAKLYAINPNGSLKWAFATGGAIGKSSPAIAADGTVYIGSWDDKLYAVNPNGTLKWSYTTGGDIDSSPAVADDGTVYVGSSDSKLHAVNPNGSQKWTYATGHNYVYGSPAIATDGTVYFGSYDNNLYALNPNGTLKWSYACGGFVHSSPAIDGDGTVYFGSHDAQVRALNPDGTLRWSYAAGSAVIPSPAIGSDGAIYAGANSNNVFCIGPPAWDVHDIENSFGGEGTGEQLRLTMAVIGGKPAVGYVDNDEGIYYARATTATPSSSSDWQIHLVVTDGGSTIDITSAPRLLELDGKPAFCYFEGWKLMFALSSTPTPSSAADWTVYRVDGGWGYTPDFCGEWSSFTLVNGLPAISHSAGMSSENYLRVRYSRATTIAPDDIGDWTSTWATNASGTEQHQFTALANHAGKPVIAWYKQDTQDLYYAAASSAAPSGPSDWTSYAVDSASYVGRHANLKIIAGKPAIGYLDWVNNNGGTIQAKYARATTGNPANSGDWSIHTVSPQYLSDYAVGLTEFNGVPALALPRPNQPAFALAHSSSPGSDTDWSLELIEDENQTGSHLSLHVLNGSPIVAYFNFPSDLSFARRSQ